LLLAACLGGAGCAGDKAAAVRVQSPLAVDAWGWIGLYDACGGGHLLCLGENVETESFTVDPPGVLEVLPTSGAPADLLARWQYALPHVVHGLAPGTAHICGDGTFNDGTERRVCVDVGVEPVARVGATLNCGKLVDGVMPSPLVPAGTALPFDVTIAAADGTELGGYILHPVDDAQLTPIGAMSYSWTGPAAGDSLTIGSPLDATFSATFATFGADRVTAVVAVPEVTPPTILSSDSGVTIDLAEDVDGRRACAGLPVAVQTETPGVCLSLDGGKTTWTDTTTTLFSPVSEGTCRLSIGVTGSNAAPAIVEVPFYMLNPDDQGRDRLAGTECLAGTQPTCSIDRHSILACRGGKWTANHDCASQICDYTAPAAACTSAAGCVACR
jgi:hypothetical protein